MLPNDRLRADRRHSPRYEVFGCPARIGWWEGAEFRTVIALLKDISRGGVAALAEATPPPETSVWISLLAGPFDLWVEANVVEARKSRSFRHVPRLLRMRLVESCPDEFYQAAIRGFHLASKAAFPRDPSPACRPMGLKIRRERTQRRP